jgi:hypothetical protein
LSRFGVHFARGLSQLNNWVSELANTKHTEEFDIDFVTFLGILGNFVGKMFAEVVFGVFESVTPKRFANGRFHGIFRSLKVRHKRSSTYSNTKVRAHFLTPKFLRSTPKAGLL